MRIDIGIGEFKTSSQNNVILKTYALGSCVALTLYCAELKTAGLIHIALPDSSLNPEKANKKPFYFADTGIEHVLNFISRSANKNKYRYVLKLIGGANIMDDKEYFNIGKRNIVSVKRILWKNGFGIFKEEVGGDESRTVSISVNNGEVVITSGTKKLCI